MKTYKIVKSSRSDDSPPYAGPTCARAKVKPGRVYGSKGFAERDACLMLRVNPVGFKIVTMGEGADETDIVEALKELATEHGRHYFSPELVAEEAGEKDISALKRAVYRLSEYGRAGYLPNVPEEAEADRITSICLGSEVLI